jgi:hypothetical protein
VPAEVVRRASDRATPVQGFGTRCPEPPAPEVIQAASVIIIFCTATERPPKKSSKNRALFKDYEVSKFAVLRSIQEIQYDLQRIFPAVQRREWLLRTFAAASAGWNPN